MSDTDFGNLPIDPEDFSRAFDELDQSVENLQSNFVQGAEYSGYIKGALSTSRRIYSYIIGKSVDRPELVPILISGMDYFGVLNNQLNVINSQIEPSINNLASLASTVYSVTSSTGTMTLPNLEFTIEDSPFEPPPFMKKDREVYAAKFYRLDATLGSNYRGVWETYYVSKSEPIRGALFLLRQTFDHLFSLLSPDDDVRSSPFWQPKVGNDINKIHRIERIQYAANEHIREESKSKTLSASANHVNEVYNQLNLLHSREAIDPVKGTAILNSMSSILEEWIETIEMDTD